MCSAYAVAPSPGYLRRYNCVTGGVAKGVRPPAACWQRRFPRVGHSILAAMPTLTVDSQPQRVRLSRYVALGESIATLAEARRLDVDAVTDLIREYGLFRFLRVREKLPDDPAVVAAIDEAMKLGRWRAPPKKGPKKPKPARPPKPAAPTLAPDFEKAIALWRDVSQERARQMIARGNKYESSTADRREADARRFLTFVESQGVARWPDVAQRHLDAFTLHTSRGAAKRVFTFLRFAQKKFPFAGKILRPRERRPDILARLASEHDVQQALDKARKATHEASLAVFLVALYAQTVRSCHGLAVKDVRRTKEATLLKFSEVWVPLDDETAALVHRRIERMKVAGEDQPLFASRLTTLAEATARIARCDLKKLRLAAVANILQSGYTDRRGIKLALGISSQTVRLVELVCGWDTQDSVSDEAAQLRHDLLRGKLKQAG